MDVDANQSGDALGEYLRSEMGKRTQLMVVVSTNTKGSWWVPWEIGIATEKDYPIATYAGDNITLPEYLKEVAVREERQRARYIRRGLEVRRFHVPTT